MDILLNEMSFEDFALEETPCCVNDFPLEFMGLVLFQPGLDLALNYDYYIFHFLNLFKHI